MKTKKDKHYIPILDQPIEELKKPIGEKVDFNAVMKKALFDRDDELCGGDSLMIVANNYYWSKTQIRQD